MKNNPDMVSFEDFIRQQSDDFRMYPSKRVWHSVYNNLHPGRKWPSISMCIVLLTTLFLVGYLNTRDARGTIAQTQLTNTNIANTSTYSANPFSILLNETFLSTLDLNGETDNFTAQDKVAPPSTYFANPTFTTVKSNSAVAVNNSSSNSNILADENLSAVNTKATLINSHRLLNTTQSGLTTPANKVDVTDVTSSYIVNQIQASNKTTFAIITTNSIIAAERSIITNEENLTEKEQSSQGLNKHLSNKNDINVIAMQVEATSKNSISETALAKISIGTVGAPSANKTNLNTTERSWIENYALYNKPVTKKWKGRVETQLYITPSVVYRQLHDNAAGKDRGVNPNNSSINNTDVNNSVNQSPSLGLEMGFNWLYQLPKGIKLKAGFQLNYTRYAIHAFDNHHPTATSLSMNRSTNDLLYEVFRSTPYSNSVGLDAVKLHNQTVQISIPMGLDIKLAGNDNIEWYAGATIQPSYTLMGKSYLLSSDRRNYVKDNSMLNHFNMNAGFETYLSFKKDGYTLQVGPQLRTQLFSTNSKMFTIEERLKGYGLKIGIRKKL